MDAPSTVSFNQNEDVKVNISQLIEALDELTEQLWHELDGKISRQRVREVVAETGAEFFGATVTNYIPLLVRRQAGEKLAHEISQIKPEAPFDQAGLRQRRE